MYFEKQREDYNILKYVKILEKKMECDFHV